MASMKLEVKVAQALTNQGKTLATAESCTGGYLAHTLTEVPGSSQFFICGLVTYSNESKSALLGVGATLLKKHGAVSEQVATAMAKGVRSKLKTDYGIGISGIAGPDGGSKQRPVGLVYICVAASSESLCLKCQFQGQRSTIKKQATIQALNLLDDFLNP